MPTRQTWFRVALGLWGLAVLLALVGYALDAEVVYALSLPLRRAALAVTVLWALLTLAAALWREIRGGWRRRG